MPSGTSIPHPTDTHREDVWKPASIIIPKEICPCLGGGGPPPPLLFGQNNAGRELRGSLSPLPLRHHHCCTSPLLHHHHCCCVLRDHRCCCAITTAAPSPLLLLRHRSPRRWPALTQGLGYAVDNVQQWRDILVTAAKAAAIHMVLDKLLLTQTIGCAAPAHRQPALRPCCCCCCCMLLLLLLLPPLLLHDDSFFSG